MPTIRTRDDLPPGALARREPTRVRVLPTQPDAFAEAQDLWSTNADQLRDLQEAEDDARAFEAQRDAEAVLAREAQARRLEARDQERAADMADHRAALADRDAEAAIRAVLDAAARDTSARSLVEACQRLVQRADAYLARLRAEVAARDREAERLRRIAEALLGAGVDAGAATQRADSAAEDAARWRRRLEQAEQEHGWVVEALERAETARGS